MRVSSMPTINGEKIVCRLLDKTASVRSLDEIGVTGKALERLRNIISMPQGMIIVILVGEIRDIETALAAFQAAMTGHLVFTSLYTNSTIATIRKFSTCPYCGTPQRLICQHCHTRLEPDWVAYAYCGQK